MASVWEAHDELLGRAVAVKLLASHLSEDGRARQRFQREARAAAAVSNHPNVVTIYDVGEHDGRTFMVMELLKGGTVADKLRAGDRVSPRTAMRWLRDAASALDAAHAADVVHRDPHVGAGIVRQQRLAARRRALVDEVVERGVVLQERHRLVREVQRRNAHYRRALARISCRASRAGRCRAGRSRAGQGRRGTR